jgi:hypothetical protein
MPHKFKVGDIVTLKPAVSRNVPGGVYEVIKVLPDPDGEREYRIKSANEPHERVARESELRLHRRAAVCALRPPTLARRSRAL